MDQKSKILKSIKEIAVCLNRHNVSWLIGGSGSLLLHGLDVTPNDIDVIVEPADYEEVIMLLKDILANGEVIARNIDKNLLTIVDIDGVAVFVHKLEVEYDFYKARTDKVDANKRKIELIEKALSTKSS